MVRVFEWEDLHYYSFNLFVHTTPHLSDLDLHIDDAFWICAPWCAGAEAVFNKQKLCEPPYLRQDHDNPRNFLQHVARLGGVNFRLSIGGIGKDKDQDGEDWEKEAFRRALEKHIQEQTFQRPWLADDGKPECSCRKRLLKECCIWDRDRRIRRRSGIRTGTA